MKPNRKMENPEETKQESNLGLSAQMNAKLLAQVNTFMQLNQELYRLNLQNCMQNINTFNDIKIISKPVLIDPNKNSNNCDDRISDIKPEFMHVKSSLKMNKRRRILILGLGIYICFGLYYINKNIFVYMICLYN